MTQREWRVYRDELEADAQVLADERAFDLEHPIELDTDMDDSDEDPELDDDDGR
jgi:hypothetical protein